MITRFGNICVLLLPFLTRFLLKNRFLISVRSTWLNKVLALIIIISTTNKASNSNGGKDSEACLQASLSQSDTEPLALGLPQDQIGLHCRGKEGTVFITVANSHEPLCLQADPGGWGAPCVKEVFL